jgi:hypothetical protein
MKKDVVVLGIHTPVEIHGRMKKHLALQGRKIQQFVLTAIVEKIEREEANVVTNNQKP